MRGDKKFVFAASWAIFVLTVSQLAVATFVPGIPQFEGKAFSGRLMAYPLLMLAVPAAWKMFGRASHIVTIDWAAVALIWMPFLVDVTGNSADLYDSVVWWDDANHFFNWLLLCSGIGLILRHVRDLRRWEIAWMVTGIGAVLAILWELAEWYTFIRHGTELNTAYEDTLGDMALGTFGGFIAGLMVMRIKRRDDTAQS
ncbi:MAG: hypothetical protein WAP35_06980 [Solirubrobacterales bacterium]